MSRFAQLAKTLIGLIIITSLTHGVARRTRENTGYFVVTEAREFEAVVLICSSLSACCITRWYFRV